MLKRLAVYCGASAGKSPSFLKMATDLGYQLADNHIDLVYGGGKYGLMGAVANAVLNRGGCVYGVTTKELVSRGTSLARLTALEVVSNLDVRKERMMALADGLLALPGGLGTLEEVSEAFSWTVLGDNVKPVAIYNFQGFYSPLRTMIIQMARAGFIEAPYVEAIKFANSFLEVVDFMNHYQAPAIRTYPANSN